MSIIFFLLLNFFLLTKHKLISSWVNVFDLNSASKISLLGGIFLISNIFLTYIFFILEIFPYEHFYKINVGLLILGMFILGFIDDKFKIKPSVRLLLTFFLIFFFLQDESYLIRKFNFSFFNNSLFTIENSSLSILFTIFCIMSFVNALNFFDGINLQVILYTIGCVIYLFFIEYSYFLLIILVTLTFFSCLNYQNKSFLGDSGTYVLAIVISLSVIDLHNRNLIFADQIIFLFLIPGFEIVRLFLERIYKKKKPLIGR
jgi:UDP-GlcNAc:undecaprenyl-phosphate GlcNAc-1-phosphate transferase